MVTKENEKPDKTALHAAWCVYEVLKSLMADTVSVYPVVTTERVKFPAVCVTRTGMRESPVKLGKPADTAIVAVGCYSPDYITSLEVAETVRGLLENNSYNVDTLTIRSCQMSNATEEWSDGIFAQVLIFNIKL